MGIFQSLVFYIFLVFTFSGSEFVCGNTELRALMEIKASLDPENKFLESWTENGDPCSGSFQGIACNDHRKVANISLQGKGLSGRLSPALAGLKCLSGLYLHYNYLSGKIPREIGDLTELTDLYLNVNNLSGSIPSQIGNMVGLQVLQLCCNQLTGNIPADIGSLRSLSVVAFQNNRLSGEIPALLGKLAMLKRLDLSFNSFSGTIPLTLAANPQLEALDVRNNCLSGIVPPSLRRLNGGFQCENNSGLCGTGFPTLRACTAFDNLNVNQIGPFGSISDSISPMNIPEPKIFESRCNHTHCPGPSSKLPQIAIVVGVVTFTVTLIIVGFLTFFRYRRRKQKIGMTSEFSEGRPSTDLTKDFKRKGASPLVCLEYSHGWDPLGDGLRGKGYSQEDIDEFKFNLEEVEYATHCFSEVNLLGRSSFSSVYRGILRDGSLVAIRSINVTSCKSEEAEFLKGLKLLTSIRHGNVVGLRGFCCSRGRAEWFLVYDLAPKGKLSKYIDVEDGSNYILDWSTRVSIIVGIAKGIRYLHDADENKPSIIHRNISVEKVLLDDQYNPLIADCGLHKLLADDVVFSVLKASAAMGYLAPEYVTTGHFTEKSDIFAFGVIILQILSGKLMLTNLMRSAAGTCKFEDFIDKNLNGKFSEFEAAKLGKIALLCMDEIPENRPTMQAVIQELTIAAPVMATFLFS